MAEKEVGADYIGSVAERLDRFKLPGGVWKPGKICVKGTGAYYQDARTIADEHRLGAAPFLPLPLESEVQGAGLGILKYIPLKKGEKKPER